MFVTLRSLTATLWLITPAMLFAQGGATVYGKVLDPEGRSVPSVYVLVNGLAGGETSDVQGNYEIIVPADRDVVLRFSTVSFEPQEISLRMKAGERKQLNVSLSIKELGDGVVIEGRQRREPGVTRLDPKVTRFIPTPREGVESLLAGQVGVVMRNELSSGYSVRGGNFDENLVYVNDIEVYRPFLVRSGQQEGLSFPNPDLIERIHFSAGGFEARYGDKMSSVLDIHYKRPKEFAGSAALSLLGGSAHMESSMMKKRLRQISGFRYRRNKYLLSSLDTKGQYDPVYSDLQSYWTYDLNDKIEVGVLGIYSSNKYTLIPENRETELGNFNQALRFTVFFEGQEQSQYETFFGAVNTDVKASKDMLLKFTLSAFRTYENERFDILAQYRLQELERDLGSSDFGEAVRDLGVGTSLDHARNQLEATVLNVAHKGFWNRPKSYLQWGASVRSEVIDDKLSEWTLIDSADFSIPQGNDPETLELQYALRSKLALSSYRIQGYVQNAWKWKVDSTSTLSLTAGVRGQHWTFNSETVVSPRAMVSFKPAWRKVLNDSTYLDRDYSFWFATGLYYQPAFYRELRRLDGTLNPNIRAQRSIHFVLGMDRLFRIWDRPFKFTAETYYKLLDDLIPYEVDNVRIRYYGENLAKGYATGIDLKLNGEFIKDVESWASISVLSTWEDLKNDFYVDRYNASGELIYPGFTFDQVAVDSIVRNPGSIPRPTDQRVNFAMFFQDEMPRWPTYKVHLSLVFGTGLPFGPPTFERYRDTLRTSLYRRVDIGFSKQLIGARGQKDRTNFLRGVKDAWISLEIFNLLNINNTINYTWVQDVNARYYAIPDFLTPRRLNVKLIARF